jgi:BASS family bile acid:Na+ symporter
MQLSGNHGVLAHAAHFTHRHFIWLLLGCYVCAALMPGAGLLIQNVSLGQVAFFGESSRLSLSMVMMGVIMMNGALSVERMIGIVSSPKLLLGGLAANMFLPVVFLCLVSHIVAPRWGGENLEAIIVALALVSAVPVAGASTAYTQNTDGDVSLAVGFVLTSTFLSPLLMPVSLDLINHAAVGDYTQALAELKGGGTFLILLLSVILPSFIGLTLRLLIGASSIKSCKPILKLLNSACVLMMIYINASIALPKILSNPDFEFLAFVFLFVTGLCLVDFFSGWWIARLLGASRGQCLAMMYGVGMNNNGTALVLGSLVFSHQPKFLVPLIFYGLIQHLAAGGSSTILDFCSRPAVADAR